jgi:2,4-dienoyl-CoA reductase-like NADH-dependent reductase (Old Yellow Enzyme family)
MAEGIADSAQLPGEHAITLYSNWAEGGWGLVITGMHLRLF